MTVRGVCGRRDARGQGSCGVTRALPNPPTRPTTRAHPPRGAEWVEQAGLVRYDKTLLEQSAAAKGAEGGAAGPAMPAGARKRKADLALEVAAAGGMPSVLRLHMPPLLKKVLLDDFKQHNVVGALLPLPRKTHGRPSVSDILREFAREATKEATKEANKEAAAAAAEQSGGGGEGNASGEGAAAGGGAAGSNAASATCSEVEEVRMGERRCCCLC